MRAQVRSITGEELAYALKVYSDDFVERVWAHSCALGEHYRPDDGGLVLARQYIPHERMLVFPWAEGRFLSDIVDDRKPALLREAARVAAELHRLPIAPDGRTTAPMVVEETLARSGRLRDRWPETAALIEPLLAALQEAVSVLDPEAPAPIHGDLSPGQFVWTGDRLVLLDLDMFGYADPAYDAGHFLAQMERRYLLDPALPADSWEWLACFRDAYLAAMPGVSARNVSFYRGVTLVRKIYTVCRRAPVEGPTLAPRLAARARAALEDVTAAEPAR
jgi:tRNA A-37 threonylcarbamoyl transferase component Bud32